MRYAVLVVFAAVCGLVGWSARGWAQPAPKDLRVNFSWRDATVTATCGEECAAKTFYNLEWTRGNRDQLFTLIYRCDEPCRVRIDGTAEKLFVPGRGEIQPD